MTNRLLSALAALAIAFSSLAATPVRAETNDFAKVLAGIAFIAILNQAAQSAQAAPAPQQGWSYTVNPPRNGLSRRQMELPNECLVWVPSNHGAQQIFGARCLARDYAFAHLLPERCEVTLRNRNQLYSGFSPYCLQDAGFRWEPIR